ncbi:MAG TPA: alpha/beta fold hydrolase [Gemmatimonadaceae bacterium]|nr:alpha/beta fold hydrolase [Gemmatimonadaceae bacterium]
MRILFLAALFVVAPATASSQAAPCTTPTTPCEQWVAIGGGPAHAMVYSTFALDKPNSQVTRAFILIHGTRRNADHYFETATAAAFLAGALGNTVVIAPHLKANTDTPAVNEVLWPNRGDSWRSGGMSTSNPTLSAFDFMDDILRRLSDKKVFPNLTKIVVAGHSAGGQFVTRYEMANKVHGTLGTSISYVVANPSSYAWPASVRPLPVGNANPATADKEALGPDGTKVNAQFTYGPFDSTKAPTFNHWPTGLEGRAGYSAQMTDDQLRKQLAERPTTYLFGQVDVLPLGGFDSSPPAMAQGPTRRARGEAFVKYITDSLGARPNVMIVDECGHNDRCIFTTNEVFPAIFPR